MTREERCEEKIKVEEGGRVQPGIWIGREWGGREGSWEKKVLTGGVGQMRKESEMSMKKDEIEMWDMKKWETGQDHQKIKTCHIEQSELW